MDFPRVIRLETQKDSRSEIPKDFHWLMVKVTDSHSEIHSEIHLGFPKDFRMRSETVMDFQTVIHSDSQMVILTQTD